MSDTASSQSAESVPSEMEKALESLVSYNHQAASLLLRLRVQGSLRGPAKRALNSARYLVEALEGALTETESAAKEP